MILLVLILLSPQQVDTSEQGWTCPLGLGLTAVDGQCGQGVPACMEGGWSVWVVSMGDQCW